ncbi:hypothetical protein [Dyadobacter alkalitolerans]|uniref:hypothetical protein n=1 Tax=Dyadobacter alkalitolerans TaxID=492736 RepID=UPI0003F7074C|nr:hypothetical protein [Dyadobacter alkalitolerans]
MARQITHEDQFQAFKAIKEHHLGLFELSKKDLFTCDTICNIYAADKIATDELYQNFIHIVELRNTEIDQQINHTAAKSTMTYKVYLNHYYFNKGSNLVVEVELPIIPRVGEYIDPWALLSKEEEESILKQIDGGAYMQHTYVREIRHEFEKIQHIHLYLDNTTLKERAH